jgi:molecular chaperone GrpE
MMSTDKIKNTIDETNEVETTEEIVTEEQPNWEEKLAECEDKYKRALADYQNLEKRVREERISLISFANKELLLRFLPILDTLILAQEHTKDQGVQVSVNQFLDTLRSENIIRIETEGKEFDPELMEAVGTDKGKDGIVLKETRAGYLYHDKLLRPAQVIVGKE